MALKLYPDAAEPITIPLSCDPSIIAANTAEALAAFAADSDPSHLEIPKDATIVTLAPMGTRARARLQRMYDEHPGSEAGDGLLAEWLMSWSLCQCIVSIKHISDFPDVVPTTLLASGLELYPRTHIDRMQFAAVTEIAMHARRISELDAGKAALPEQPSGSPTSASPASGTAYSADSTTDCTSGEGDAPAHSSTRSAVLSAATV